MFGVNKNVVDVIVDYCDYFVKCWNVLLLFIGCELLEDGECLQGEQCLGCQCVVFDGVLEFEIFVDFVNFEVGEQYENDQCSL